MSATSIGDRRRLGALRTRVSTAGREQSLMAGAQLTAGVGNLAFTLVCARLLTPHGYSHLASFLAAYLLLYTPFSALSASAASHPELVAARRARIAAGGVVLGGS